MFKAPLPSIASWAKQLQEHEYQRHRLRLAGKGAESDEHAAKLDALMKLPGFEPLSEWVKNSSRHVLRPLALKAVMDHVKAEAKLAQSAVSEMKRLNEMESEVKRIAEARSSVYANFVDLTIKMDRVRTRAQIKRHEAELRRLETELNAMDEKRSHLEKEIQAASKSDKALQTCRPILEAIWYLMNRDRSTEFMVARPVNDLIAYFSMEREDDHEDVKHLLSSRILAFSAVTDNGSNIDAILIRRGARFETVYPPQESILLKIDQDVSAAKFVRQWIQKLPQENTTPDWYSILRTYDGRFSVFTVSTFATLDVPSVDRDRLPKVLPSSVRGMEMASAFKTNGGKLQNWLKKITPDVTMILNSTGEVTASSAAPMMVASGETEFVFLRYPPPSSFNTLLPLLEMEAILPKLREEKKASEPRNERDPYALTANSTPLLAFEQSTTRLYDMSLDNMSLGDLKREQTTVEKHPMSVHVCWVKFPVALKSAAGRADTKETSAAVVAEPFPVLIVISSMRDMVGVHMQLLKPLLSARSTYTCMYVSVERSELDDRQKSLCTEYTDKELLAARSFPQHVVQFASAKWTPCSGWSGCVHDISGDGGCAELIATPNAKVGSTFVLLAKSLASLFDVDYLTLDDAAEVHCPALTPESGADTVSFNLRVAYVVQKGMPWYSEFGFVPKQDITAINFINDVFGTTPWSVFHDACAKALAVAIKDQPKDEYIEPTAARLAFESLNRVGCGSGSQPCTVKQVVTKASQVVCGSFAQFTKVMSTSRFVAALIRKLDNATRNSDEKSHVRKYDLHVHDIATYFSSQMRSMIWFRRLTGVLPLPTTSLSPPVSVPKSAGWQRPMLPLIRRTSVPTHPMWRPRLGPPPKRRPSRFSSWQ